jgi:hypothetical protein
MNGSKIRAWRRFHAIPPLLHVVLAVSGGFFDSAAALAGEELIAPLNVHVVANWDEHPVNYTAADVWADDLGYAYVCNRTGASIDIMDISDPASPFLETTYVVGPPNNFANAKEVKVADGFMFIGLDDDGNDGVEIVDVRDPAAPQFFATIRVSGFEDVHNLFYDKGFLYLANSRDPRVAILDLRGLDPDDPPSEAMTEAKWVLHEVGESLVHDVTAQHGRLYACGWDSGIYVYDVSRVADEAPVLLAFADGDNTHAVWPTPDGRWIVTNEERTDGGPVKLYEFVEGAGGFEVIHRSTYSIPLSQASSSHNVYVVGRRVYCAWYNRGLMAFDINEELGFLELVAHFDTSVETASFRGAWGVYPYFGRDQILLSDKETQFWVFDVRIPGSGDFDGDADVDLRDFGGFQRCFDTSGAGLRAEECEIFDFSGDGEVDEGDFEAFSELASVSR